MNESDRRQRVISSTPRLSTEEIANRSFAKGVRGFSETEVRAFLKRVAEEIAAGRVHEQELEAAIDALEEQLRTPRPLSEQELLDALGEETARLLRSAREASDDIRNKAEERAARLVDEAAADAERTRAEAADAARVADRGSRGARRPSSSRTAEARAMASLDVGEDGGRGDPRARARAGPRDARRGEGGARARARRSRAPARAAQRADRSAARRARPSARRVPHRQAHVPRRDRSARAGRSARRGRAIGAEHRADRRRGRDRGGDREARRRACRPRHVDATDRGRDAAGGRRAATEVGRTRRSSSPVAIGPTTPRPRSRPRWPTSTRLFARLRAGHDERRRARRRPAPRGRRLGRPAPKSAALRPRGRVAGAPGRRRSIRCCRRC